VKSVKVHRLAAKDADDAIKYYDEQLEGLGIEFTTALTKRLFLIQQFPLIGTPYKESDIRYSVLDRFPYVIYYREYDEYIGIFAVAHARRREGYWKRRRME
jgi:toxin ParE1/3/4